MRSDCSCGTLQPRNSDNILRDSRSSYQELEEFLYTKVFLLIYMQLAEERKSV